MFARTSLTGLLALLLLQLLALTVASPLHAHQIEELRESLSHKLEHRQASSSSNFTAVTGVTGYGVQPRLEIRQLQANADQWNIYLLGLNRMMQVNESEKLSYYQIAGIHGRPYVPWDGVGPYPGNDSPGFCTHVSNLFLPWHRPYLALYEQVLFSHIIAAVNEFPAGSTRSRYATAALSWRHPYWDWAAAPPSGESALPASLTALTVSVITPNGSNTIPNPLYSYRFHPVSTTDFVYNPFASWNQTMRAPTDWSIAAVSQDNTIGPILDNNRISFMDRLYNLFTSYDNFTEFGNEAWMYGNNVSNADSLESLHDAIHGITGGNGHMTYLDYSAFDPIFWLHHTMIDRCFAIWQALYNQSYVEPMSALESTFSIPANSLQDVDSPLEPFHSSTSGTKHTAASVRSTRTFGYTYPEIPANGNISFVRAAINKLYGSNAGTGPLSKRFFTDAVMKREDPSAQSHPHPNAPGETTNGRRREYLANIVSNKFALNGSYAIYVFLGDFDSADPTCWPTAANLVGTHVVFAALPGDAAGNGIVARNMAGGRSIPVAGTMPLTSMLLAKVESGDLKGMRPQVVEAYLAKNLHWRVAMFDNTEIANNATPGLAVTVVSAEVEPATSPDEFPRWGGYTELKHVTAPPQTARPEPPAEPEGEGEPEGSMSCAAG